MVVIKAKQLVSATKTPWTSHEPILLINDAAVVVKNGIVTEVGDWDYIKRKYPTEEVWDFSDSLMTPGLVDPHTHLLFAGSREDELERKLMGETYEEITKKGGGIYKTIRETRNTSTEELKKILTKRLETVVRFGTTTVEIKTGYGLDAEEELRLAQIIHGVKTSVDVVSTFLVHIPPPHARDTYLAKIVETLPQASVKYVDVFCDAVAFTVEETRTILKAAEALGYRLRLHADELAYIGCSDLIEEFPIDSLDHLLHTPAENAEKMAKRGVVATLLPITILTLRTQKRPPIEAFRKHKVPMALGTDFSPNSWCLNMQTAIELAVYLLGLTPLEALMGATVNAAYSLRLTDRGVLAPGKLADIVVWDVPNYQWLAYEIGRNKTKAVIKKGELIYLSSV